MTVFESIVQFKKEWFLLLAASIFLKYFYSKPHRNVSVTVGVPSITATVRDNSKNPGRKSRSRNRSFRADLVTSLLSYLNAT